MNFEEELDLALRSRCTLVIVRTAEEERALDLLERLCKRTSRSLIVWDHADWFQGRVAAPKTLPAAKDAISALEAIEKMDGTLVVALRDFHQCLENTARVVRKLRNLAHKLKYTRKSIVLISPIPKVPEELKDDAVVIELPRPNSEELEQVLKGLLATPGTKIDLDATQYDRLIRSALGLSANQAQRVFARGLVSKGVLELEDIPMVAAAKEEIVRESGALEFLSPVENLNDVGGLDVLKDWLRLREKAFTPEARRYGLPPPKGVVLVGIPGTGKSLTAKTIASLWRVPLLRLDIGALFGSLVGESEERARKALSLAGTVAPCILWIDEIEKGLATGDNDGGTSRRVLGTILSWMQERTKPVFLVATANDISRLPPELLRRGRLDEIFFLDLPTVVERKAIFSVHLLKRKRDPERFDLDYLALASAGYVGAEIEQAVIDAMYLAFNDTKAPYREFTTADIGSSISRLVPMSRSQRELIEELRRWLAEGRAQSASISASIRETEMQSEGFVPIPLETVPGTASTS